MPHPILPEHLDGRKMKDGDRIRWTNEQGKPGKVQFLLKTKRGMWFKGIKLVHVYGIHDDRRERCRVQADNGGEALLEFDSAELEDKPDHYVYLEVWKAKAFAVHTHIYDLAGRHIFNGKADGRRIVLDWFED